MGLLGKWTSFLLLKDYFKTEDWGLAPINYSYLSESAGLASAALTD